MLSSVALLVSLPAWSQTSGLTGTVTDPSGAVIPGAKVTLTHEATGVTRTATTASDGGYVFSQLVPGNYKIEVTAEGFKTAVREHVPIAVGLTSTLDIHLEVGAVAETVVVEAEVSGVNTTDASIGNPFSGSQVLNLPSLNLDPSGLLSLQAGVTYVPGAAEVPGGYSGTNDVDGRGGSVNGSRSDQTNITLDGVDVNDAQFGYAFTSVLRATQASLQEFRVTTTNYNADLGRSSGAEVQLVTKSGTNNLHGLAYWAHRNELFNANDFFLNRDGVEKGKFRRHIYGLALGGPVIKDRLFLFGNWEELKEKLTSPTLRAVPSMSFRDGVLIYPCEDPSLCPGGTVSGISGSHTVPAGHYGLTPAELAAIDPLNAAGEGPNLNALAYFQQYPVPNAPGTFDRLNIVGFNFNAPFDNFFRTLILKADFNIDRNAAHTIYWRGTMHDDNLFARGPQFPDLPPNQTKVSNNKGFALGYKAVLSPNVVNTFRWGLTRVGEQTAGVRNSQFFDFRFIDSLEGLETADVANNSFGRTLPQHHFRDDLSWTRGRHTLSFGGEVRFTRNKTFSDAASFHSFFGNPSWLPNVSRNLQPGADECTQPGCTAVPAVASAAEDAYRDSVVNLLGLFTQVTANYNFDRAGATQPEGQPVKRRFGVDEYEFYFQDQWRATPSLTFTGGIRYLLMSPPWETNGNQVTPTPGLGEWFETRRQFMLAGIPTNRAPQISFALGGPANNGRNYYDWDYNNWSPRISAAWSPHFKEGILGRIFGDGKLVVRGGYSLVYDRMGNGLVTNFDRFGSFGMSTGIDSVFGGCGEGPSTAGPLGVCPRFTGVFDTSIASFMLPPSPGGSFPATPPGADLFGVPQPGSFAITSALDNTLKTPYAHMINFSIARTLPGDLTVEAAYVGRRGRNLLIISDLAMPADLCDPASKQCYFRAGQQLIRLAEQGQDVTTLAPIAYWENLFPSWGPSGINGGELPCSGGSGFSATQVAFELMNCVSHPDTTVFPWLIDNFGYPGYMLGGPGAIDVPQIDTDDDGIPDTGDGIPDAPFAFFDDQFASLNAWRSISRSEYHALQLMVRKRMRHGVQFDLNYTLSKSLDMSSSVERSDILAGFSGTGGYTGSTINSWSPQLEYSLSDFDMRHQFNANWLVELPFGRGRWLASSIPGWGDQVLGGWQVSGIVRLNSGLPANAINARVWPTNWDLQGNATCQPATGSRFGTQVGPCPATQNVKNAAGGRGPNMFADPDAAFEQFRFTLPGERGERNILRADKYFNLDFGLAKKFRMPWEGHSLMFRWETFNLTNSAYFDAVSLQASIGRQGTFGDYSAVLGGPRRMQFTFRYEF